LWWQFLAAADSPGEAAKKVPAVYKAHKATIMAAIREYSVYLVRCGDGSIYTGIATDVTRRIAEHEDGGKGAKFLRGKGPLELVYQREIGSRSLATRLEYRIKQIPPEDKRDARRLPATIESLLDELRDQ
jgi:putative endonuclease